MVIYIHNYSGGSIALPVEVSKIQRGNFEKFFGVVGGSKKPLNPPPLDLLPQITTPITSQTNAPDFRTA